MSAASERRKERLRKRARKELGAIHDAGRPVAASADSPHHEGVRQTVSLQRTPAGTTNVRIEYYEPLEWDATLDSEERDFADLDTALGWLDLVQGVHWSQLHEPGS
jgi:hypothetical protein